MTKRFEEVSCEEAEAIRHDPQWGDPVRDLAVHASHWIESASAFHPERAEELEQLALRLSVATGDLALPTDVPGWISSRISTDGEVVHALSQIVEMMRIVAPLLNSRDRHH